MRYLDHDRRLWRFTNYKKRPKLSEIELQFEKSLQIGEFSEDDIKNNTRSWVSQDPRRHPTLATTLILQPIHHNVVSEASQIGTQSKTAPHPHSVVRSLCSYQCVQKQDIDTIPLPLLVAPAKPIPINELLCQPRPHGRGQRQTATRPQRLLPQTGKLVEGQSRSHGSHSTSKPQHLPSPPTSIMAVRKSFDVPEISPLSKNSPSSIQDVSPQDSKRMSESVERLIRETDAAFQAVGSALADARASTQGWENVEKSSMDRDNDASTIVVSRHSGANSREDDLSKATSPGGVTRSRSVKSKRRKLPSILRSGRKSSSKQKQVASTSYFPRMTLRDVLTGRVFKLEADELPNRHPARLPVDEQEERHSYDSNASLGLTPTDPFHLESLTARLETARAKEASLSGPGSNLQNGSNSKASIPIITRTSSDQTFSNGREALESSAETVSKTLKFHPSPPRRRKSKVKHRPTLSKEQMLKPIPEIPTPLASPARHLGNGKAKLPPLHTTIYPCQKKGHVLLESTRYTETAPQFMHGPIRIDRPERDGTLFSPIDDRLDWTAFQMAILGTEDVGGGDWRRDWEIEADEREIDDIMKWWEGFGFEGYGGLQGPSPEPTISHPAPYIQELPSHDQKVRKQSKKWGKSRTARTLFSEVACLPTHYGRSLPASQSSSDVSTRRVELDGKPLERPPKERRHSMAESLPPSPMLDLGEEGEAKIPMGYNLGHDLGDFLKWEMEHVRQSHWEA